MGSTGVLLPSCCLHASSILLPTRRARKSNRGSGEDSPCGLTAPILFSPHFLLSKSSGSFQPSLQGGKKQNKTKNPTAKPGQSRCTPLPEVSAAGRCCPQPKAAAGAHAALSDLSVSAHGSRRRAGRAWRGGAAGCLRGRAARHGREIRWSLPARRSLSRQYGNVRAGRVPSRVPDAAAPGEGALLLYGVSPRGGPRACARRARCPPAEAAVPGAERRLSAIAAPPVLRSAPRPAPLGLRRAAGGLRRRHLRGSAAANGGAGRWRSSGRCGRASRGPAGGGGGGGGRGGGRGAGWEPGPEPRERRAGGGAGAAAAAVPGGAGPGGGRAALPREGRQRGRLRRGAPREDDQRGRRLPAAGRAAASGGGRGRGSEAAQRGLPPLPAWPGGRHRRGRGVGGAAAELLPAGRGGRQPPQRPRRPRLHGREPELSQHVRSKPPPQCPGAPASRPGAAAGTGREGTAGGYRRCREQLGRVLHQVRTGGPPWAASGPWAAALPRGGRVRGSEVKVLSPLRSRCAYV